MRSALVLFVSLFAVAGLASAQRSSSARFSSDCVATSSAPSDVNAIKKLTQDWAKAYVARDRAWFERNYADEVVINGKPRTKEEEISHLEAVKSFETSEDYKVKFYGNAAIATGTETVVVDTSAGGDKTYRGRFTNVFVQCSGRWLVAVDDWFPIK